MLVANCWVVKGPLLAEEVGDAGGKSRIQGTEGGFVSIWLSLRFEDPVMLGAVAHSPVRK